MEFLKFRRDDIEINSFYELVNKFWNKFMTLKPIAMFLNPDEMDYVVIYSENYDEDNRFEELFLRGPISQEEKESLNYMLDDTFCPLTF